MRRLIDRIEALPTRYAQYKPMLHMITSEHSCTTKSDIKRVCTSYLKHYDKELEQTPKVYKRLRTQTKQCKKVMHNCLQKAVPLL